MSEQSAASYWPDTAPQFKSAAPVRVGAASGRNGDHCNGGLVLDYGILSRSIGREWAMRFYRAYCEPVDSVERALVATAGASEQPPFAWFLHRIVPVGSFFVATEPQEKALLDRPLPRRRNYVTSKNVGNYSSVAPDKRLIFGGRAHFTPATSTPDSKNGRILKATLAKDFSELAGARTDYCLGGNIDLTADGLPRAGEHGGLFYAMGCSDHGAQMSLHMGGAMAELQGGNAAANPWRDLAWSSVPGRLGKPGFLPLVGPYYRGQDLIH